MISILYNEIFNDKDLGVKAIKDGVTFNLMVYIKSKLVDKRLSREERKKFFDVYNYVRGNGGSNEYIADIIKTFYREVSELASKNINYVRTDYYLFDEIDNEKLLPKSAKGINPNRSWEEMMGEVEETYQIDYDKMAEYVPKSLADLKYPIFTKQYVLCRYIVDNENILYMEV